MEQVDDRAFELTSLAAARLFLGFCRRSPLPNKKADVAEHPKVFHHVGLLFNAPSDSGRIALYLVFRMWRHPTSPLRELQWPKLRAHLASASKVSEVAPTRRRNSWGILCDRF